MSFKNENTYLSYLLSKKEDDFHLLYEQALEKVREKFGLHYKLLIGNNEYQSNEEFTDYSPIDKRIVLGYFPTASNDHVSLSIEKANESFEMWKSLPYLQRIEIFNRVAQIITDRKFELSAWISFENGKNRYEAIADVDEAIDFIKYYSLELNKSNGFNRTTNSIYENEKNKSVMKPYGVWIVISPFNFPVAILTGMLTGVIITGNTAVLKPSSDTPLVANLITKIFLEAGVPPGVINYISGRGSDIGNRLVESRNISGIVFTGSKETGFQIQKKTVNNQTMFIAELGGKNPVIVSKYTNLDKAVEGVVKSSFGFGGQKCSACSRIFIHKDVKNKFMLRFKEITEKITVGDPTKRESYFGPLINDNAYKNYKNYIVIGKKEGNVLTGGNIKNKNNEIHGFFVEPTIIDDLKEDSILLKEELFVPIVCTQDYTDFKDAITKCNQSEYGLTAGLYSENKEEINYFLDHIQSGVVYINRRVGATTGAMVGCQSFGGWKSSGNTGKGTGGPYYLLQFLKEQSQTIIN